MFFYMISGYCGKLIFPLHVSVDATVVAKYPLWRPCWCRVRRAASWQITRDRLQGGAAVNAATAKRSDIIYSFCSTELCV